MGAGRLLGGKVAGEVEASYLEQAIQAGQAGKTPTEKMKLVAAALEDKPGMGAQYMKALSEARRLEAEDFTMTQAKEKARTKVLLRGRLTSLTPTRVRLLGNALADITQC
jgi:cytochrome c553